MATIGAHLGVKKWVKKALGILDNQTSKQILDDGVGAEQSISYQLYTMEYYLLTMLCRSHDNIPVSDDIYKRIEQAADFIKTIINEDGSYPDIGDNDSGCALKLSENYPNAKTILNLASYINENMDFLQGDVKADEKLFWLIGPENFEKLIDKATPTKHKPIESHIYTKGGYCIFVKQGSKARAKMIFDFGPLGMHPMAGHGHADALSFVLYVNNRPVFIDPGTYSYYSGDFWRNYFRGTSAHNTIRIDSQDQSIFSGRFLASYHARTEYIGFEKNKSICARHYGYGRLKTPVIHTRTVNFPSDNSIDMADKIETRGEHLIEQFFHLDKNCKIGECGENIFKIVLPETSILLKLDRQVKTAIYYGNEVLPLGWQSFNYGSKEKIFSIVGRIRIRGNTDLITGINY
jgi:hypothetical protein